MLKQAQPLVGYFGFGDNIFFINKLKPIYAVTCKSVYNRRFWSLSKLQQNGSPISVPLPTPAVFYQRLQHPPFMPPRTSGPPIVATSCPQTFDAINCPPILCYCALCYLPLDTEIWKQTLLGSKPMTLYRICPQLPGSSALLSCIKPCPLYVQLSLQPEA